MNEVKLRREPAGGSQESAAHERPAAGPAVSALLLASCTFLLASTLFHILLIFHFPLAPDEAYYWQWSRHLDLGYYDQGPMIAWWIRGSCLLFGDTPLGVRFGIVLAALATQISIFLLTRDLFGSRPAFLSLIPSTLTPLAMAGGFIATYDPLVVLFWASALYFASHALFYDSRRAWYGLGVSVGLGLLTKHTMILFLPCLLLLLWTLPGRRSLLLRPQPWIALCTAILVFSPNIWWQATHDWMTFRHLFLLAGKGLDQSFGRRLGDFLGSQVGLITPLLFIVFSVAMTWCGARGRRPGGERLWFLFCFSMPVLLLFLVMTVKSKVQANWAVCGWLTPPIAAVLWLDLGRDREGEREGKKGGREEGNASAVRRSTARNRFYNAAIAFAMLLCVLIIWPETRVVLHLNVPYRWDQMNKLYGGAELAAAADPVKRTMEAETGGRVALGAVTYDNASRMAFYMEGQPETCCLFPGTRLNSYVLWNDRALPKSGGSMLLCDDYPPAEPRLAPFGKLFDRVECDGIPIQVYRRGVYSEPIHTFYLYRCYGYRPNPAVEIPSGG